MDCRIKAPPIPTVQLKAASIRFPGLRAMKTVKKLDYHNEREMLEWEDERWHWQWSRW